MPMLYIDGDEVRITKSSWNAVDIEFFDGRRMEGLEPRRLFPLSGLTKYITLLDNEGNEHAIIRNLDNLIPESRKAIEECLTEYYFIPKITRIISMSEKFGNLVWTVETDRGVLTFQIHNRRDIKVLYDGRILIRDSDDNRYEIKNANQLDRHSRLLLSTEL